MKRDGERVGGGSRTDIVPLLKATVAALHCRQLLERGCTREARVELSILRRAISEITSRAHENETAADLAQLQENEQRLATALGSAVDGEPAPYSRPQPSPRVVAMLLVGDGEGSREVRLSDFLGAHADDADTFERVGALTVGKEIEVDAAAGCLRVRRIS